MNKRVAVFFSILLCLFLFIFAGCSEPDVGVNPGEPVEPGEPGEPSTETRVYFDNTANAFPVTIYIDSARQVPFTEIPAGDQSSPRAAAPNSDGAHFYPTYQIKIEGLSLPYDGEEIITRVDANKTTKVTIGSLKALGEASPDKQLTNNTYIKIQNSGTFSLTLRKGQSELLLEGVNSTLLNGGETGLFKIQPGPVTDYSLRKNTVDDVPFPDTVTQFTASRIYTFNFDGTGLTSLSETALTLGEAGKIVVGGGNTNPGSGDGTEASPIQLVSNTWANGSTTASVKNVWYSFSVLSGTTYYIWWNDSYEGNNTKTADVKVSASYSGGAAIFTDKDDGWSSPQSFRASSSGTVKLKVTGYDGTSGNGTFGIVYNTTGTRPAVPVTYTVTYNINSGTGTVPTPVTGASGTIITLPNGTGISRSGYVFGGWNINSSGSGTNYAAGSSYTITANITLYVKWNSEVTITFDKNSGTGTVPESQKGLSGTSITLPGGEELTRTGYVFGGWNTSSAGTGTNYEVGSSYTLPSSNTTLYAKWNPLYTVTFDANGGTGAVPPSQTVNSGTSITLPGGEGLSKTGYIFGGWVTSSTGTTALAGTTYTPTSSITLYVKWNVVYTVTFDASNGSGTLPAPLTAGTGSSITLPSGEGLSRSGYVFGGWSTSSGTALTGTTYTPTSDTTLYVKWNPLYTVSFDANGGTGTVPSPITGPGTSSITLPSGSDLSRPGFNNFKGWSTTPTGTALTSPYTPSDNVTLYALWQTYFTSSIPYLINDYEGKWVQGNDAIGADEGKIRTNYSFTVTAGNTYYVWWNQYGTSKGDGTKTATISVKATSGSTTLFDTATATGTDVYAWATPKSFTAASDGTVNLLVTSSGISYNGSFAIAYSTTDTRPASSYNVSFRANGGSGVIPSVQTVDSGTAITLPDGDGLFRIGYVFAGWSTSSTGTALTGTTYTPTSDTALYAIWTSLYTVTFNANGGYGAIPPAQTVNSGTDITLPSGEGLNKTSYVFGGWSTTTDGTALSGTTYTVTANTTLYAKWNAVYTVTFGANGGTGTVPSPITGPATSSITLPSGSDLSRSGYVFGGWNTNTSGTGTTYNAGASYTISTTAGNVTLYAKWNTLYVVSFSANGGTGEAPSSITGTSGTNRTLPGGDGLSRSGYIFGGWYSNSTGTGGDKYAANSEYTIINTATLYALWYTSTSEGNPFQLTANTWAQGNISVSNTDLYAWYSFEVTSGYTYNVWWNDSGTNGGDGTKTMDIYVTASYGDGSVIFDEVNSAWSTPRTFTANSTGTVKLKVFLTSSGGTYAITYSASSTRP